MISLIALGGGECARFPPPSCSMTWGLGWVSGDEGIVISATTRQQTTPWKMTKTGLEFFVSVYVDTYMSVQPREAPIVWGKSKSGERASTENVHAKGKGHHYIMKASKECRFVLNAESNVCGLSRL